MRVLWFTLVEILIVVLIIWSLFWLLSNISWYRMWTLQAQQVFRDFENDLRTVFREWLLSDTKKWSLVTWYSVKIFTWQQKKDIEVQYFWEEQFVEQFSYEWLEILHASTGNLVWNSLGLQCNVWGQPFVLTIEHIASWLRKCYSIQPFTCDIQKCDAND